MRDDLPTGIVTLLFTDVEGSTKLLRELGSDSYAEALADHRRIVREACATEGGVEVDTQGDAFFFAFPTATGAVVAAQVLTEALAPGPIQLRIGMHTCTPLRTDEGYVGDDVHLAARVAASGHGGQVVLSQATRDLVDGHLTELGEHRLKDIEGAVSIFQLGDTRFPPLNTISNTNLPQPASSFVGRMAELGEVLSLLDSGSRLLTLTGPGGSGKTRLALEAAATLVPSYKAGVFWVGLASLRDASLVIATISQTIGSANGLAEHIGERQMLLLLDNLEHVIDAAPELSALLLACPNLTLLVTSRELLRVRGEVEYEVPPLASPEAVTLFCERSRLEPTEEIAELCSSLDDLPLALELAAARTKALSPRQILERLGQRLDLLEGGRDADPRQQTLRATIAWSHGLLSAEEQRHFRALSVFRGGCTLEAAEKVADVSLATLQSLVEKSLLRFSNERYWLLETIREYAREGLVEAGEIDAYAGRHADYFLARLEDEVAVVGYPTPESLAWCETELDNLRAMLGWLLGADPTEAARAAHRLFMFWQGRGAYAEAGQRLEMLLDVGNLTDEVRAETLVRLADMRERLGDLDGSEAAATEALTLSGPATHPRVVGLLITSARAVHRGNVDEGVRLAWLAVQEAEGMAASTHVSALGDLGYLLIQVGRRDEARAVIGDAVEEARRSDLTHSAAWGVGQLGFIDLLEGDYESAARELASALTHARSMSFYPFETEMLHALGYAYIGLGRRRDARVTLAELLELASGSGASINPEVALALCGLALAVESGDFGDGARLLGSIRRLRRDAGVKRTNWWVNDELERRFEQRLIDGLGGEAYSTELANGTGMNLEQTLELARSLADS